MTRRLPNEVPVPRKQLGLFFLLLAGLFFAMAADLLGADWFYPGFVFGGLLGLVIGVLGARL